MEPTDVIHLVCYSTDVDTVLENVSVTDENFEALEKAVNEVIEGGRTDLWGGVQRGSQLLTKHQREGFNNRLFLFSDGLVNCGEENKGTIMRKVSDLYEEHQIQVSAFGLGDDFDEKLMKGIAERGIGTYFFIENADSIPTFVDFALKSLQKMVGVNAALKVQPSSFCSEFEFYGKHDVAKGAILGDLRADNSRTVMAKAVIRSSAGLSEDILDVELTYERQGAVYKIKKTLAISFTDDPEEAERGHNIDVIIKAVLQKSTYLDKKIGKQMEKGKTDKCIELQKEQIELFKSVNDLDKQLDNANKIGVLLAKAKAGLEKLEKKGVTKKAQKEVHHRAYMARRG